MKIKFLIDYRVADDKGTEYTAGQIIDCNQQTAQHFIIRRAAMAVQDDSGNNSQRAKPKPRASKPRTKKPKPSNNDSNKQ